MRLLTVTNLYPRPDQPQRGMYNAQLFRAMAKIDDSMIRGFDDSGRGEGSGDLRPGEGGENREKSVKGAESRGEGKTEQKLTKGTKGSNGEDGEEWERLVDNGKHRRERRGTESKVSDYSFSSPNERISESTNSRINESSNHPVSSFQFPVSSVRNLVLVPEWRVWRWAAIRLWKDPFCTLLNTEYLPVFYVPVVGRDLSWRTYLCALRTRRASFEAADAVLATWLYPDAVAAVDMARTCGKPVWIKVHGTDMFHLRNPVRRERILEACSHATGFLPHCQYLADKLVAEGIPAEKAHVVRHGVDTDLFRYRSRAEAMTELKTRIPESPVWSGMDRPGAKSLLFVGNLAHEKGPDIMLEAFSRMVSGSGQSAVGNGRGLESSSLQPTAYSLQPYLLLVGDGPMRRRLEREATRLGLADRVFFLGSRPHEEIALWMNVADCLCLPSRSEGMPNVALEALASGAPVLAADVGACRELLEEHVTFGVCDPDDVETLAQKFVEVLAQTGDRSRAVASKRVHSWGETATHMTAVLLLKGLREG